MFREYKTVNNLILKFMDSVGDGSGSIQLTGNYSSTPGFIYMKPPAGQIYVVNKVRIKITDTGTFDSGGYGNGAALTNGIEGKIMAMVNGVLTEKNVMEQKPVKTNCDWGAYCHEFQHFKFGSGDESLLIEWNFNGDGLPIMIDGDDGEYIFVEANDDMSGLNEQVFLVSGYKIIK